MFSKLECPSKPKSNWRLLLSSGNPRQSLFICWHDLAVKFKLVWKQFRIIIRMIYCVCCAFIFWHLHSWCVVEVIISYAVSMTSMCCYAFCHRNLKIFQIFTKFELITEVNVFVKWYEINFQRNWNVLRNRVGQSKCYLVCCCSEHSIILIISLNNDYSRYNFHKSACIVSNMPID